MKNRNERIAAGIKRIISVFLALTFVLNISPSEELGSFLRTGIEFVAEAANKDHVPSDKKFNEEQQKVLSYKNDDDVYILDGIKKIEEYSKAYYSFSQYHQGDTINIDFSGTQSNDDIDEFLAIGTEQFPFRGKIILSTTANNKLVLPEAFFDYVYDSVQITDSVNDAPSPLIVTRTIDDTGEPVLARHVLHDSEAVGVVNLQVQLDPNGENNYSTGGIIGEMDANAKLILDVTDNTSCDIYGTDDIGYICGKMGSGSSLNVRSVTGTKTYSVETANGNAGGVVGSMAEGSVLELGSNMPDPTAAVTANGDGHYAGGIIGYNDGGTVRSAENSGSVPVFSSASKYTVNNELAGTYGSGGVFGYYRPVFQENETTGVIEALFDISWLQIGTSGTRMTANGNGSVGGLFGVLVNESAAEAEGIVTYSSGDIKIYDSSDNSAVIYMDHSGNTDTNNNNDIINYGGVAGRYTACDLDGSLEVKDVSVNVARSGSSSYVNYGGGIGITEGGNGNTENSLYVRFDDYRASVVSGNAVSDSVYGGLIARSANAFVDAKNVTLNSTGNFYGGGVIGRMDNGVLRLSGTTDLTGGHVLSSDNSYYEGQIVGGRDSSLIFAEYDPDNSRKWVLKRSNACAVDDIGSWGEVLRFDGISTSQALTSEKYGSGTVLTVNETEHTVTVGVPAAQTTISSAADFAMIALRFQLEAVQGLPVKFDSNWSYDETDIIDQDITLSASVSLAGTGLTGLTRDNAENASDSAAYCVYKGKFDGGNNKLTLAVGEPYGMRSNTSLTNHNAEGNGRIYRHIYTGLFGIVDGDYGTSSDYTVKDLTISGTVDVSAKAEIFCCGGFAARSIQDFSAYNVATEGVTTVGGVTTGLRMTHAGDKKLYMGRLVGEMGAGTDVISVSGTSSSSKSIFDGTVSGTNSDVNSCFGGVIGRISHKTDEDRNWYFTDITLKGSVSNTASKATQKTGGLIAEIAGDYNRNLHDRTLTLDGVETDGLKVTGSLAANGTMGGLLGYAWIKTDVAVTDVDVKNSSEVNIGAAAGNTAGLMYCATGHWTITSLDISGLKMTASGASSVGAIVNKGYYYSGDNTDFYSALNSSAIYLELPAVGCYSLVLSSSNISTSAVFDELCAYTCPSAADIMKNGNGIISVATGGFYTNGSTASGSYHAQTSYGAKPNPNSRYYYDLTTITADLNTPQKKLMSWGVNTYACENLKQYFADPFGNEITDAVYDMNGYSWYPVNVDSNIKVNGTFTFNNRGFEESEAVKYASETNAYKRTSLYDSAKSQNTQHYLMHNGLFYDVYSCTLTVGSVELCGNIAGYSQSAGEADICGALVCGRVYGSSSSMVGAVKTGTGSNDGISLAGIVVYNVSGTVNNALNVSDYAPLLINRLDSHSSLNLGNVSTTSDYNYTDNGVSRSRIAATSLIGDAGSSSATDVNAEFRLMTLDGRNSAGAADTALRTTGQLDQMYSTYNSIFSKATFLNSLSFSSGSSGRYNFTWKQDWDTNSDDTADALHRGKVTYGKELGYDSVNYPKTGAVSPYYNSQYPDEEFKYYGSDKYTNPVTANETGTEHQYASGFLSNFLPYVAERYNADSHKYQLQVNHAAVTSITGCGTYDHPYVISTGDQIESICAWINNSAAGASIRIPAEGLSCSGDAITGINGTWCADHTSDVLCVFTDPGFECSVFSAVTPESGDNPSTKGWYERSGDYPDYTYTVSSDTSVNNNKKYYTEKTCTLEASVLQAYLAGAYYKIDGEANAEDLIIDDEFDGLGKNDNAAYRFRGVFDGNHKTITNKTSAPFIYYSNGCVVKDLTISVEPVQDIQLVGYQVNFDSAWSSRKIGDTTNPPTGNDAYGAVISRVMGGDTVIENVFVSYTNMTQQFDLPGKFAQLVPVGGYIGVIVNGGVIFRNMGDAAAAYAEAGLYDDLINGTPDTAYKPSGKSQDFVSADSDYTATTEYLDNMAWLYINPYIGRVINGFAVTESEAYAPYENGERAFGSGSPVSGNTVTLQNGRKHYSITDIDTSDTIDNNESDDVNIDSGQDLFLMSLIINSGIEKETLGYKQAYKVSRSADYSDIGTSEGTSTSCNDYNNKAKNDVLDSGLHKSAQYGYLSSAYNKTGKIFADNNSLTLTIDSEVSGDIILPDGFKGIGNLFNSVDAYRIKIVTFDGSGKTISQNTSYYYYDTNFDTAYPPKAGVDGGLGFINYISFAGTYQNLFLTGNVKTDLVSKKDGSFVTSKSPNALNNGQYLSAGMLIGTAVQNTTIENMALTNIDVFGLRNTGGLVGYQTTTNGPDGSPTTLKYDVDADTNYDSDKIKVHGRASTGGMIGKLNAGYAKVDMGGNTFNLTEVVCDNTNSRGGNYYDFGVGGFVGMMRANVGASAADNDTDRSSNFFKNIVIGTPEQRQEVECENTDIFTAGVVGIMNKCAGITIEGCTFYNLSVVAKFGAAGLVAFPTTRTPAKVVNTHLLSPLNSTIESTTDFAGGMIGSSDPRENESNGSREFEFNNCSISGYTIAGKKGAGGIIGFRGAYDDSVYLYLNNIKVTDCTMKTDDMAGGLIGEMNEPVVGYNILASDIAFDQYTPLEENQEPSYKAGYICGSINTKSENCTYNTSDSDQSKITNRRTGTIPFIKLAGFSRQDIKGANTMITELVGHNNAGGEYGSGGYVVFADYNNTATTVGNELFSNVDTGGTNVIDTLPDGRDDTVTKYAIPVASGGIPSMSNAQEREIAGEQNPKTDHYNEQGTNGTSYSAGTKLAYLVNNPTALSSIDGFAAYGATVNGKTTNGFYIYCVGQNNLLDDCNNKKMGYLTGTITEFYKKNTTTKQGQVIAQSMDLKDAEVYYFEKATENGVDYYKIYKVVEEEINGISQNVKYYIYHASSTTRAAFSKNNAELFEVSNGTDSNGKKTFRFKKKGTTKEYLLHSNGGGGIRYYVDNPNGNCDFIIYSVPDEKALKAWDYGTVSETNGTFTFSTPSAESPRTPTAAEIADFTYYCNNSQDQELYYVTKTETVNKTKPGTNLPPYVTTNPKKYISGTQFLTGDAVGYNRSITYANSTIGAILNATDAKKYTKTGDSSGSAKASLISKLNTYGKYSSYQKEMGLKAGDGVTVNFPVVVWDDATKETTTEFFNNYLQYLTNTSFDFAEDNSDVFNIQLGACIWDAGTGRFDYCSGEYDTNGNANGSYLLNRSGEFQLQKGMYDNEVGARFTLIDVQFYDPGDTSANRKIAYHLYVPVLIKKMLYYDFHSSFLSGTNYRIAPYENKRSSGTGNTLIDNIGNPVTLEVQWTYDRDLAGWQSSLESGEDLLHTSFDRIIRVTDHIGGLPDGTQMVLVDVNRKNSYYYASKTDVGAGTWQNSTSYNFNFTSFRKELSNANSAHYSPPVLNDYFDVTVTNADENANVKFKTVQSEEDAIISDGTNYYAIDNSSGNTGGYVITLSYKSSINTAGDTNANTKDGKIQDDYYITFFTENDTSNNAELYHLEFDDRGSFGNSDYPTLASDNYASHIITGDIFVNENFSINDMNTRTEMSLISNKTNDKIWATFSVDVGVNEALKNTLRSSFGLSNVEVYQSFLIMLKKQSASSSVQGIASRPSDIHVSEYTIGHIEHDDSTDTDVRRIDYRIDVDPATSAGMSDPNTNEMTTANHIELRGNTNLKNYMKQACESAGKKYNISATFELSYTEEDKLAAQFPTRDSSNLSQSSIGTLIGGSSNVASTPEAAVYSKNVAVKAGTMWETTYSYYCTINTNAILTLNSDDADNDHGEFYQFGINANDIDPESLTDDGYVPVKLKAVYDVSDLSAADNVQNMKSMKLTFTVSRKQNYGTTLDIAEYIDGLAISGAEQEEGEEPVSAPTPNTSDPKKIVYTVTDPSNYFDYDPDTNVYQIPVSFNVIIGDQFGKTDENERSYYYSNYMIKLEIEMFTDTAATENMEGSKDDDHVVYTHAKLLTSIIE